MIGVQNLMIRFGERVLFDNVSFVINPNDKIGLIGKNGVGKTTLFKLITKEMHPDSGSLAVGKEVTIGLLSQYLPKNKENNILQETLTAAEEYYQISRAVAQLELELYGEGAPTEIDEVKAGKLVDLQEKLYSGSMENPEAKAEQILMGLGFKRSQLQDPIATLSGGWQMRIELAKLLLQEPKLLLLDEPTNHLDIDAIIWFEKYIQQYPGAVILISHDETFLRNCTTRILEIAQSKFFDFKGSLAKYQQEKALRLEMNKSSYENQQKVLAQKQRTINRFMAKATKTKMAQSMQKQVDKIEKVELETVDTRNMRVNFPYSGRPGRVAFTAKNIHKSYADNHVIRGAEVIIDSGDKVAFVGQNGQGKTTLLKILSKKININEGTVEIGHNIEFSYYDQEQADLLDSKMTLLETLEYKAHPDYSTKLRKVLGAFMFSGEDVDKKVSVLSGGERARLALACMVVQPSNCLILDEPTNHLDMDSKAILREAVLNYEGTVLVVSHDRAFLDGISTKTIEFKDHELYNHIGDINEVLRKRDQAGIREISLKKKPKEKVAEKEKQNRDDQKKLQRKLNYIERDIEKIETQMKEMEQVMAEPGFYESATSEAQIKSYTELKNSLESKMAEWEKLGEEMEG